MDPAFQTGIALAVTCMGLWCWSRRFRAGGAALAALCAGALLVACSKKSEMAAPDSTEAPAVDVTATVPAPPPASIPEFPWPPPVASTSQAIAMERILGHPIGPGTTLRQVDTALAVALNQAGHAEWSYYRVPGGFALATRLESIQDDGSPRPGNARWDVRAEGMASFSLSEYLKALFMAPVGHYRVIVFIVTAEPFAAAAHPPTAAEASTWVAMGGSALPEAIARQPVDAQIQCRVQVYEFRKEGSAGARFVQPGHLVATVHLQKTGLGGFVR